MSKEPEELRTESTFHPPVGDPGTSLVVEVRKLREQQTALCTALKMLVEVLSEKLGTKTNGNARLSVGMVRGGNV